MKILKFASCQFKIFFIAWLAAVILMPATACADEGMARKKTIYFPQFEPVQSVIDETNMLDTVVGKLTLSEECLRVESGGNSYLLIWPGWYIFDIISGNIVVSNLRTGAVVAQFKIGDTVSFSGGELENRPVVLKYTIPDLCNGPYLAVGDIESIKPDAPSKKYYPRPDQERENLNSPKQKPKKTIRQHKQFNYKTDPKLERSIIR